MLLAADVNCVPGTQQVMVPLVPLLAGFSRQGSTKYRKGEAGGRRHGRLIKVFPWAAGARVSIRVAREFSAQEIARRSPAPRIHHSSEALHQTTTIKKKKRNAYAHTQCYCFFRPRYHNINSTIPTLFIV